MDHKHLEKMNFAHGLCTPQLRTCNSCRFSIWAISAPPCAATMEFLVKPNIFESNVLFSVLLFSKSVFVKSLDNPFSAAGAWPWSLRVAT